MKRGIQLFFIIIALLDVLSIKAQVNEQAFRPSDITTVGEQMRVNMYVKESNGSNSLYDGTLSLFDDKFNNEVDLHEDAPKMHNFTNNFAIYYKGVDKYLTIDKRKPVVQVDSIFFRIYAMQRKNYELEFITEKMDRSNIVAHLEDMFLNTKTIVSLNGSTRYAFTINANEASKNPDRFRLVFNVLEEGPLPVTFTNFKGTQKKENIDVQWTVANQVNVKEYQVEVSANGRSFITKGTIVATVTNGAVVSYNWLDANPLVGDNFYRIRSIDQNGKVQYTQIVKVNIGTLTSGMQVYPNPVRGSVINLQMNNMPEGVYYVRLLNTVGQVLLAKPLSRIAGSSTETIKLNQSAAKGVYNLEVVAPDKTRTILKVLNQ